MIIVQYVFVIHESPYMNDNVRLNFEKCIVILIAV